MRRKFLYMGLIVPLWILLGCSPKFGIRPDEPPFKGNGTKACSEFIEYANYTQNLQEAYRSRASQNRFWIYVSGTTALATLATSAGLAAASSASLGTLALVPIAGGFVSGFFAVLDNPTLADIYTIAANRLETTLQEADDLLQPDSSGSRFTNQPACAAALKSLRHGITQVKNDLERARTDSAVAALQRAASQTKHLNEIAAQIQGQAVIPPGQKGEITKINPPEVTSGSPQEVALTVVNVNLSLIGFDDVKVDIGGEIRPVSWTPADPKTGTYEVKFKPPDNPPVADRLTYTPVLLVGNVQKTRVECRPNVSLTYKPVKSSTEAGGKMMVMTLPANF